MAFGFSGAPSQWKKNTDGVLVQLANAPVAFSQGLLDRSVVLSISADQNDWNPGGGALPHKRLLVDGGTVDRTITGIVAPSITGTTTTELWQVIELYNSGTTNNLILTHQDVASTAGNRVTTARLRTGGSSINIPPNAAAILAYDRNNAVWDVFQVKGILTLPETLGSTGQTIGSNTDGSTSWVNRVQLAGQLGGTTAVPDVRGIRETGTPTLLTIGAIADGETVVRSGNTLVGAAPAASTHDGAGTNSTTVGTGATASADGTTSLGDNALADALGATVLGRSASVPLDGTRRGAVVVGEFAGVSGFGASAGTAIGRKATAGMEAVAIGGHSGSGAGAAASGGSSVAVGFLSTSTFDNAVAIGPQAAATAAQAVAIGRFPRAQGTSAIAIGDNALASISDAIAIGNQAQGQNYSAVALGRQAASGQNSVALGAFALAGGLDQVSVGVAATATSSTEGIAVGRSATVTSVRGMALGKSSTSSHNDAIALGHSAVTTAINQIVVGSGTSPVTDIILGEGGEDATPPTLVRIRATPALGTDIAGGDTALDAGAGTGTGVSGEVLLRAMPAGGTGAVENTPVDRVRARYDGVIQHAPATAIVSGTLAASQLHFYLDETGNNLKVVVKYADGTTVKTGTLALV